MKSGIEHCIKIFMFFILPHFVHSAAEELLTGKVVGISDGDTFILLHGTERIKVRLFGIDCPETDQPFGAQAHHFTDTMIFGKRVDVALVEIDRSGRIVGKVIVNGRCLNHQLVRNGLAWWYRHFAPDDDSLAQYEAMAKKKRIGLWAADNPVEPWKFRRDGVTP